MISNKAILAYTVEEHHEAFYVWKHALSNRIIKQEKNTLLHVDEHSDMSSPTLDHSIHLLNGDLTHIRDFTYRELNIATFIVPAIYQRLFDRVCWIKQRHNKTSNRPTRLYVRSSNDEGKKLVMGRMAVLEENGKDESNLGEQSVTFRYYKQHMEQVGKLKNVMLDIDLDYFSCIQNPLKRELRIEITEKEFNGFMNTPYHRLRFFDFGRVLAERIDGRYYYLLNSFKDQYDSPLKVSEEIIQSRINVFIDMLRKNEIVPQLITVCRSRYSGYTPEDQWNFIERQLMEGLNTLYTNLEVRHISSMYN